MAITFLIQLLPLQACLPHKTSKTAQCGARCCNPVGNPNLLPLIRCLAIPVQLRGSEEELKDKQARVMELEKQVIGLP